MLPRVGPCSPSCLRRGTVFGDACSSEDHRLAKEEAITLSGKVVEALAGARFRIQLESGHIVLAHVSGKMRKHFIRILPGDTVTIEVSPYDLTRGRITYRN